MKSQKGDALSQPTLSEAEGSKGSLAIVLIMAVGLILAALSIETPNHELDLSRENRDTKPESGPEGKLCGGIAGNLPEFQCPDGYFCELDSNDPDSIGKCAKIH